MPIDFNELFNDSYEFVLRREDDFYERFYINFVGLSAKVEKAFSDTDMVQQKLMLRKAVSHMVNFFVTKKASDYLVLVARKHAEQLQVDTLLYDQFIDALLITLAQAYPKYNSEVGVSWRITLAPGIEFMKNIPESV